MRCAHCPIHLLWKLVCEFKESTTLTICINTTHDLSVHMIFFAFLCRFFIVPYFHRITMKTGLKKGVSISHDLYHPRGAFVIS